MNNPGEVYQYPEGIFTNVEAIFNKMLLKSFYISGSDFKAIYTLEDGLLTKKNLTKLLYRFWKRIQEWHSWAKNPRIEFWDVIHEFNKFLLECSGSISWCSPSFDMQDFVVDNQEIKDFKDNLISVEPFIAFHQNLVLFEKVSEEISKRPNNILNLVFNSGARLKSVQLLKAASNTGIPTDIYGKAFPANIGNSLLDGLTPEEYFITSDSARLALAVRQEAIPKGGELQRKFFFTVGILKLDKECDDCGTNRTIPIEIKSWDHLKLLNHRWYQDAHPSLPGETEDFIIDTDSLDENVIESHKALIGRTLNFYSPITCAHSDYRICRKCFGDKQPESINLGSTVGAALSEGIIQSVLRAHHFGGAFIAHENKELLSVLKRCSFQAPDTIIGTLSDIEFIQEYLKKIYPEEDIDLIITKNSSDKIHLKIVVNELPFNDDSVKALGEIVGLIDKNRDEASMIAPDELYNQLLHVIEENNILSVYLELIISLLYYDEDGILYRYTDKPLKYQTALKNIIEVLDPKLSIFYNFSNRVISKIYNHHEIGKIDHMYYDLLEVYS
jgi:hypothetical protein